MTAPRPRRRVLMTADTVGGVWPYALDLARALAPLDVEVALATMGAPPTPDQARAAAEIPGLALFVSDLALEWMPSPWREVDAAGDWLVELARRVRPDVVHLSGYTHAPLPFGAPVVVVAHSCVVTWWRAVHGGDPPAEWDEYRRRVTAGLAAADAVVAPTEAILRAILDAYGLVRRPDTHVLANGRDPSRFAPAAKEPLVFAAGRLWDEAKNLAALDACAERVPWPIVVAGSLEPPGGGAPRRPRAVRALGRLDEAGVAAWMGRASIYALPARYEPFGLSPVEAARSGCALVLGDVPTLREVWGDAAVFVPPDDPRALGDTLAALADDAPRRAALARAALARAATFTPARMAAGYRALYDELIARRP